MGQRTERANHQLAELISEAGISRKRLARRVVDLGTGSGFDLRYDHNSVRRWLDGEQPQAPVPELIAAVFTEELGRRVRAVECGLSAGEDAGADLGLEFGLTWTDTIDTATDLWKGDAHQRRHLTSLSYAVAVYPAATMRWLTLPGSEHPVSDGHRRIGLVDIESLRAMTATFAELDNKVGGGRVRSSVVQYLHADVASMLHGTYTEDTGRDLFSAAAELTKLAGWMAYDEEHHGLAQRYLIQALRMAKTADDQALGAEILAAMSHQATYVGRPGDAVDLARAAQIAASYTGLGSLESACHVVEAHGHAARNDARSCAHALTHAESAYDRASDVPDWLAYYDEAYLSAKVAHCFRDLGDDHRTSHYATQSLDMADGYLRGRAFNLCLLASAYAADDPQEAVRLGNEAATIIDGLASRRSHSYLRDLRRRLNRHTTRADVAAFRTRVAELTARG